MMRAFLEYAFDGNIEITVDLYTSAIEVLKWGAEIWRDVSSDEKGAVFQPTFMRGVKCLRLDALMKACQELPDKFPHEELLASADEILSELANSVVKSPALSRQDEDFIGVATTFLDGLRPGNKVQMVVRPSGAFRLPLDPSVPVVMIAAESGVAQIRGFIQERALQKEAGRDVGKMLLFFGCRSPNDDLLYSKTDFDEWTKLGVLEIRPAFSRDSEKSEGCKYVQDRVWKDRGVISEWFDQGASYYFCGAGKVALGVKAKLGDMIMETKGYNEEEAAM